MITSAPFHIDFIFDKIAAAYMFVGVFLMLVIAIYSRPYWHKEKGYKRFINNIFCIYIGYNLAAISGNVVTLAVGLLFTSIPAVLLILFYQNRYLLVKSIVGILLLNVGVLLLLRTSHLWEQRLFERILIGLSGMLVAIIANWFARIQSSANRQIMYASTAQMGLMFVEVAAGWHVMALFHLTGNSFLRTYQLLISPSTVAYRSRERSYNATQKGSAKGILPKKLLNSIFILTIK
ncbi:hypothetical protein FEN17_17765 [Dyadobacter luticola]|uniref:NADH:quinone oxidoreductase/Mrp antiporter transmembrane domain-containing protein n=2 Tax=Dyadobacter luticola TaxID=1979387 RepID=A0A5R9KYW7_9BACT|nr:hypothetical protein FEN17_17765 [Dyadobacter luticola]